ncbi:MFS transporter [Candidatus Magnetominusculus xianensis]|uniref:MFS transporter n=1 Tax=Candidatus Magnetominusculus xianensis TaxID=1748249 RepID=A0ABR5SCP7_9BACT|nr:MFS transporter [Candidatus Magnetominusculus xianensis]KWT81180.1 MFS transporter [Candidatus Magnetominusculus xianensis]MBF0404306.1 MFS transporter [Nitrospirota bacterium]
MSAYVILCVSGLFAIFSTTMAKSPVLPLYASYLGVGPSGIGVIASISPLSGILFSIPAGILAERYGSRRMLLVSAGIFVTAPLCYLLASNVFYLSVVRFYHGLATTIFVPVSMSVISRLYADRKGEMLGMFSSSTLIGRFIAPIVGGVVIGLLASDPRSGFNAVYVICAAAGGVAAIFFIRLPEDRDAHSKSQIKSQNNSQRGDMAKTLRELFTRRAILTTSCVEAAVSFSYGTFETFLPLHLISKGLGPYEIGAVLSVQIISIALSKPVMGRFSDKYGRINQIIVGLMLCAIFSGLIHYAYNLVSGIVISILFGLCISVVTSAASALIADLSHKEQLSSSMGIFASVMDIGHTAGPLASGIVAAYMGLGRVFLVSSSVLAAALIMFMAYRKIIKCELN